MVQPGAEGQISRQASALCPSKKPTNTKFTNRYRIPTIKTAETKPFLSMRWLAISPVTYNEM